MSSTKKTLNEIKFDRNLYFSIYDHLPRRQHVCVPEDFFDNSINITLYTRKDQ